ncbi:serine/threonine-protein phosphatase 6 regulatory ankyrin repeat subunit B-like [Haliotis cracherodii]|uniref:serine/threonine-protein phosphatase 6 regulatory ankyrin repeat subunit B-like n=1 Tax=Haliotis cracherodii TaxID=6455 RepID=UPI0039ECC360
MEEPLTAAAQKIRNTKVPVNLEQASNPTNQEEMEEPLTAAAQMIRKRTESRIQAWTKDMVDTEALQKVTEKLERGATWVTIKGRPGEGKSTIAYMALKDQHRQGRQVYQVVSPEELNEVITSCTDPVIMLDDIFGDLEFDAAEWAKWRPYLRIIVNVNDSDEYTKQKPRDMSTAIVKGSEGTNDEQTQIKRTGPNKDKTIIILVGHDYVLKSSLPDLGRMADYVSNPQYVVEVTSQRDKSERKKIWHVHAETKHIHLDESTVSLICETDHPHGFPHVCKMFVTAYEHEQTQAEVVAFFQSPLTFLKTTMDKFLQDEIKRSLFMAMIKGDGKISAQELEEDGIRGYECITAADDLDGSYLKKEDGTYMFDHPSIYDSVALIISTKQSKFVIENCSLTFIHQRIRLKPNIKSGENLPGETDLVATIPWTCAKYLARRFATEIEKRNLLHVLAHQACCNAEFVKLLMDCLKKQGDMSVPAILKLTDNYSGQSFCELLSSNKSFHLIKFFMKKENIAFSQSEIRDILHGVCTNAACSVLTYINEHMNLEINAKYGRKEQTPLMLAAETKDSEFVNQILSLDPDLNARDMLRQTVFHYLCKYGLTSAVEHTFNTDVDVKKHYMSSGEHPHNSLSTTTLPLYCAIENGHVEVVQLLMKRGCEVDNQEGLRRACMGFNMDMVRLFLDRGARVDGDAVYNACTMGNLSIINMLFELGAAVNMSSSEGVTPLHSSCGHNPKVVSFLLEKGASVNVRSKVTGDTPLHIAAAAAAVLWGSGEFVDVLLKARADVNVQNNTDDTPLHKAAERGSAECVEVLLKAGADVNVQNNTGDTPLHEAAEWVSTECVDMLLKAGSKVNVQNNTGNTPLSKAAERGSTKCVDVLLKAGADVNVKNNTGDTPLHKATGLGFTKCVDVLLKAGADVNVQNNTGDTPLHQAAGQGSTECVDVLLKIRANVEVQNEVGDTSLHKAAERGSAECVEVLLKAGADVNVQNNTGDTPLHKAEGRGSAECVDVLLKSGAHVDVQNKAGDTPLHKVTEAFSGFTECVDVLLKAGANVNVQNNTGDTPLHKAAGRGSARCVDALLKARADKNVQNNTWDTPFHKVTAALWGVTGYFAVLLKAMADVNEQNNTGDTPLHKAAERGSTECVDLLLKARADVNVQNKAGETPLHKAAGQRSTECVDVLLKARANLNVKNTLGDTPLHKAAGRESTQCVGVLLKAGADVNVQNNTGDTPLHKAAERGSTECVDLLLKARTDVNEQNNTGDTPLHKAAERGSTECVDLLLKARADVNVQNKAGETPLHKAAGQRSTECVDVLLKARANLNVKNTLGDTPLHKAAGRESTQCVGVLLKAGADVNVQNNTGDTPLHKAAERGSTECVDLLLKAKTDVNVQNNTGDTPLNRAAERGSKECVDLLLKAGVDVNVQIKAGDTPLHKAAGQGSTECVDVLLKARANLNVKNTLGDTPLHKAAGRESKECVDLLLKAGADVNIQNNTGDSPLHSKAK